MSDDSTKDDEESLFSAEMSGVTPLKSDNRISSRKTAKKPTPVFNYEAAQTAIEDVFSTADISEYCPDILSYSCPGLQHKVLKKLRQGNNPIEQVLDLHGLTVEQARSELLAFLSECETVGIRHVIIIHGKGYRSKNKPVIKPMLNRWLRSTEKVLAFHSAQPKDGGSGAVYVLIKKIP